MPTPFRLAVYFVPAAESLLGKAGARWLGRTLAPAAPSPPPYCPAGFTRAQWQTLRQPPQRYGFHATLKAPFVPAEGVSLQHVRRRLAEWCAQTAPLPSLRMEIVWLDQFLALCPRSPSVEAQIWVQDLVAGLDDLRAPLDAAQRARRQADALDARARTLLERWGYPYTEERFRLHLTLSAACPDEAQRVRLYSAACAHFAAALAQPIRIEALSLCCEPGPGAPFMLDQVYALNATGRTIHDASARKE